MSHISTHDDDDDDDKSQNKQSDFQNSHSCDVFRKSCDILINSACLRAQLKQSVGAENVKYNIITKYKKCKQQSMSVVHSIYSSLDEKKKLAASRLINDSLDLKMCAKNCD